MANSVPARRQSVGKSKISSFNLGGSAGKALS